MAIYTGNKLKAGSLDPNKYATKEEVDTKSTVSVSSTGTATDEVGYITIDGVEKKLAGGGESSHLYLHMLSIEMKLAYSFEVCVISPDGQPVNSPADLYRLLMNTVGVATERVRYMWCSGRVYSNGTEKSWLFLGLQPAGSSDYGAAAFVLDVANPAREKFIYIDDENTNVIYDDVQQWF